MKYAILGDVHGNWEALETVLQDAREYGVEQYACVGDVVGYNADPGRCLNALRELKCEVVQGNHDFFCSQGTAREDLSPVAGIAVAWTRLELSAEQLAYLGGLPLVRTGASFSLVHSSLDNPELWPYVVNVPGAEASMLRQSARVCFYGHTHVPMLFERTDRMEMRTYGRTRVHAGARYLINTGSVGQPRDRDPRCAYVLYDSGSGEIELRRLPYDIPKTQMKLRKAGLPSWLAMRLFFGV